VADTISLTGFGIADPIPAVRVEVNFAKGEGSTATGPRSVLLLGLKSAAGIGTVDTLYGPDTADQLIDTTTADALFGAGSELARMYARFIRANPSTPCYAIATTPGDTPIAATGTVVLTGPATANGSIRYSISKSQFVEVGFITGESITTIGDRLEDAVNAKADWPFTASNAAGTITMTAKCEGTRGNQIRHMAKVSPLTGTGIAVTPVSSTAFTGGTVVDDLQNALDLVNARRFSYIVIAHEDPSNITAAATHVATLALPLNGLRQRLIAASVDMLSAVLAIASAQNFTREELIWHEENDQGTGVLAAQMAAIYTLGESQSPIQCNYDGWPATESQRAGWFVEDPMSGEFATYSEQTAALNGGVTPIGRSDTGSAYLVRRTTTKHLVGAAPNYSARDGHKVSVPDIYADDLQTKVVTLYPQKVLQDDPPQNAPAPSATDVVFLRNIKSATNALTESFGPDGGSSRIEKVAETIAETVVERSVNTSRVNISVPLRVVDCLHQVAAQINQVS
jgi:phage tail sheath gpL-like